MNTNKPAQYEPHAKNRANGLALTLASSELGFNVHTGFLDALTSEAGVLPGYIGAASSGAYIGGLYAAGFPPKKIREILSGKAMARSFLEWRGPIRGVGMLANLTGCTGLLSGDKAAAYLRTYLGDRQIEECAVAELSLAVTNLTKNRPEIIKRGSLVDFIVASCSVPGLFRGRKIAGNLYWDGAVCDSSPFYHFLDDDRVSRVLVHVITHRGRHLLDNQPLTVVRAFGQAHQIITDRLLDLAVECGKLKGKLVTVLTTEVPRYRWGKKGTADLLFAAGRETVLSNLDLIREAAGSAGSPEPVTSDRLLTAN